MNWSQQLHFALPRVELCRDNWAQVLEWNYVPHLRDNAPHRHTYCEVCLVGEQGQGEFSLAGQSYSISPGDIFFARPGVIHQIVNTRSPLMELYWVGFCVEANRSAVGDLSEGFLESEIAVAQDVRVWHLWRALREVCERSEATWESQARALGTALLLGLLEVGAGERVGSSPMATWKRQDHQMMLARTAVRYVDDNLHRKLQLAEIANYLHISPRQLTRLFVYLTGISPALYIERARLDRAENLLLKTDKSLQAVAGMVGFEDASHFSRVFARYYGMPPGAFRTRGETNARNSLSGRNLQKRGCFI